MTFRCGCWKPDRLECEVGVSPDTISVLKQMGHSIQQSHPRILAELGYSHQRRGCRELTTVVPRLELVVTAKLLGISFFSTEPHNHVDQSGGVFKGNVNLTQPRPLE